MVRNEVSEVNEPGEIKQKKPRVAAFFDLDGTLVSRPSMEKRFFSMLRCRRLIGFRNYFLWIAEAVRLAPRGINQILHANKMYLRGVCAEECGSLALSLFYPKAVERAAWHAELGHLIVMVSGTLEPLAERAARALEVELGARGVRTRIRVCATRLAERDGRWTGQIAGEAMFAEAKVRAVRRIAAEDNFDLERCHAYGDSASDRSMLEAVGKPAVVNPSNDLVCIARRNDWPVLRWAEGKDFRQGSKRLLRTQRKPGAGIARRIDTAEEFDRGTLAGRESMEHGA